MITIDKPAQPHRSTGPALFRPGEVSQRLSHAASRWLVRLLIVAPSSLAFSSPRARLSFANSRRRQRRWICRRFRSRFPRPDPRTSRLLFAATWTPFSEASLYACANGYLKAWQTDLGARVAAGQLMAEIPAPDVDAQSNQAKANLAQSQARVEIERINFLRPQNCSRNKYPSSRSSATTARTLNQPRQQSKPAQPPT